MKRVLVLIGVVALAVVGAVAWFLERDHGSVPVPRSPDREVASLPAAMPVPAPAAVTNVGQVSFPAAGPIEPAVPPHASPVPAEESNDVPWAVTARSGPVWVIAEPGDERAVLAAVNGVEITKADVKKRLEYLAKVAFAEGRARGQRPSRSMRPEGTNVLAQLIDEALLLQEASAAGVALTEDDVAGRDAIEALYRRLPAVYRMDPPPMQEFDKIARSRRLLARAAGTDPAAARKHLDALAGKATIARPPAP